MSNIDAIPTEEVLKDMADTEYEIEVATREERAFRMLGDRLSIFKADARRDGIKRRQEFIAKLKGILAERGVA